MKVNITIILISSLFYSACVEEIEPRNVWVKKDMPEEFSKVGYDGGFAIGSKGYIGVGPTEDTKGDWLEFDPAKNVWTKKSDFPGGFRFNQMFTSDDQNGYVGFGMYSTQSNTTFFKDIWQYNAATDNWSLLTTAPFSNIHAPAFVLDRKLFVVRAKELWAFDLISKAWQRKNDLPFEALIVYYLVAMNGKAIVIDNEAYYFFNDRHPTKYELTQTTSVWKYDVKLDTWAPVIQGLETSVANWLSLFNLSGEGYFFQMNSPVIQSIKIVENDPTLKVKAQPDIESEYIRAGFSINNRGFIYAWAQFFEYIPD